jgi:hypothetical protein
MQSLGLIASTPALGRTKVLGKRRRRRRMQVSHRRQMLKATFMFWLKLESMLRSILFPPLLEGHFKKWACVGPYNYNYNPQLP